MVDGETEIKKLVEEKMMFKKMLSVVLAVSMVFALGVPGFATSGTMYIETEKMERIDSLIQTLNENNMKKNSEQLDLDNQRIKLELLDLGVEILNTQQVYDTFNKATTYEFVMPNNSKHIEWFKYGPVKYSPTGDYVISITAVGDGLLSSLYEQNEHKILRETFSDTINKGVNVFIQKAIGAAASAIPHSSFVPYELISGKIQVGDDPIIETTIQTDYGIMPKYVYVCDAKDNSNNMNNYNLRLITNAASIDEIIITRAFTAGIPSSKIKNQHYTVTSINYSNPFPKAVSIPYYSTVKENLGDHIYKYDKQEFKTAINSPASQPHYN